MAKIRASEKRGKALKGGQTLLLTRDEMAEMAADLGDFDEKLRPPRRPRPDGGSDAEAPAAGSAGKARWSKPTRRAPEPAPPVPGPNPTEEVVPTRRGAVAPAVTRTAAGRRRRPRRPRRCRPSRSNVRSPTGSRNGTRSVGGCGGPRTESAARERRHPTNRSRTCAGAGSTSDESAARSKSAAAALLERLRNVGAGRRRIRASSADAGAPAASGTPTASGTPPQAGRLPRPLRAPRPSPRRRGPRPRRPRSAPSCRQSPPAPPTTRRCGVGSTSPPVHGRPSSSGARGRRRRPSRSAPPWSSAGCQ